MRVSSLVTTSLRTTQSIDRPVANVAHRGASASAPENTLAAVRRGIHLGSDLIEVDVQRSKDGALVLMHDTDLLRTTNVKKVFPHRTSWDISDFTYEELLRMDAGSWKSRRQAGERIPTLQDAIDVIRPSRAGLLLELKAVALYPGIVAEISAAMRDIPGYVDAAVSEGRLALQSFDIAAMKHYKTLEPAVPVGLLGKPPTKQLPVLATWADQINPHHCQVDASYVAEVHRLGMQCLVWTVNHPTAMRRVLRAGVDGVITNYPDVLGKMLPDRQAARLS